MRPTLLFSGVYVALALLGIFSVKASEFGQSKSLSLLASQERRADGIYVTLRLTNTGEDSLKVVTDGITPSFPSRGGNFNVIFQYASDRRDAPGFATLKKGESIELKCVISNEGIPNEDSSVVLVSYTVPELIGDRYGAWFGTASVRPGALKRGK